MDNRQAHDPSAHPPQTSLAEEAAAWVITFTDPHPSPDDPYRDPVLRDRDFQQWITRSRNHVLLFMEMMEVEHRCHELAAQVLANIRRLVEAAPAMAVPKAMPLHTDAANEAAPLLLDPVRVKGRWYRSWPAAAGAAGAAAAALLYLSSSQAEMYTTPVGAQHQYVLKDGTTLQLNTASQVEVVFSRRSRSVRLLQGEAFFAVNPDQRPFTVTAGDSMVRALGTEFDVRQRAQSVEVAVVGGKVQVTASLATAKPAEGLVPTAAAPPQAVSTPDDTVILSAGEMAEIASHRVIRVSGPDVELATAWRAKRLVFRNARLAEAVAEFNRYSSVQIRIEGTDIQQMPVSGSFPTTGYQDFLRFAATLPNLIVAAEGNNWVIRSRT